MKKFVLLTVLLMLLISCAAVFADQDGKSCWCNVDQYGCWNTGDDGGKSYIMFWSEESRQSIMGTGSAPYKSVVEKPGSIGMLPMECGRSETVPTLVPKHADPQKTDSNLVNEIEIIVDINITEPTVVDVIVYTN